VRSANSQPDSASTSAPKRSVGSWLFVSALALTGLAIIAAHAPPRVRLLVLFPVAHGLLAGWLLMRVGVAVQLRTSRTTTILATVFIAAGLLGTMFESHRMYAAKVRRDFSAAAPNFFDTKRLSVPLDEATAEERAEFERMKKDLETARRDRNRLLARRAGFRGYLTYHVSSLGGWPFPWPELLWGGEMLLATIAGALLFHRQSHDVADASSESLS
jgi:hypothetical protein